MPPPREVGDKRAANWNLSSKNSRKIITSLENSRSSIWVSVIKPPRWLCRNGPWPRIRSRKTPSLVLGRSRSSPEWRRRWESPAAPSPLYRNYSRYRTQAHWLPLRSLLRCSGSIPCSTPYGAIRDFKNFAKIGSHSQRNQNLRKVWRKNLRCRNTRRLLGLSSRDLPCSLIRVCSCPPVPPQAGAKADSWIRFAGAQRTKSAFRSDSHRAAQDFYAHRSSRKRTFYPAAINCKHFFLAI